MVRAHSGVLSSSWLPPDDCGGATLGFLGFTLSFCVDATSRWGSVVLSPERPCKV
jgi:hypothetical protein